MSRPVDPAVAAPPGLGAPFDDVTCEACRRVLAAAEHNEHGHPILARIDPDSGTPTGSLAATGMGHQYVHTRTGRTAVCITRDPVALLRGAIAASGLSARRYATEVLTRDERTVRRWLAGKSPIPRAVVAMLTGQHGLAPRVAAEIAGVADYRTVCRRDITKRLQSPDDSCAAPAEP